MSPWRECTESELRARLDEHAKYSAALDTARLNLAALNLAARRRQRQVGDARGSIRNTP